MEQQNTDQFCSSKIIRWEKLASFSDTEKNKCTKLVALLSFSFTYDMTNSRAKERYSESFGPKHLEGAMLGKRLLQFKDQVTLEDIFEVLLAASEDVGVGRGLQARPFHSGCTQELPVLENYPCLFLFPKAKNYRLKVGTVFQVVLPQKTNTSLLGKKRAVCFCIFCSKWLAVTGRLSPDLGPAVHLAWLALASAVSAKSELSPYFKHLCDQNKELCTCIFPFLSY